MKSRILIVVLSCFALASISSPATAQLGKLKDKVKEKAKKEVEKEIEGEKKTPADTSAADETAIEESTPDTTKGAATASAAQKDMALYTKYDFIPGDKVIFYDDLSGEELGEFPSRWRLDEGVFEIAKQGGKNYILCTDVGVIRPRITPGPLPPKYTIEMEFYVKGGENRGHWYAIRWYDNESSEIGVLDVWSDQHTRLRILDKNIASKDLPAVLGPGVHTVRVMATQSTLKCYVDNERVANVPAVDGFNPVDFGVHMNPWYDPETPILIGTFRYAEGGKTLKQQLDEAGKIVTHGILFDSGSDKIKGESYKTLADIGALLTENPVLRLSIEGHTDSDGADESNLNLSQKRAESVRTYLINTFAVDGNRLESKGWGESKPIDVNTTPEGKANNRRVELVKL